MKKIKIQKYFIFLFSLILIPFISAVPQQIGSYAFPDLDPSEVYALNLDSFYSGFNQVNITFEAVAGLGGSSLFRLGIFENDTWVENGEWYDDGRYVKVYLNNTYGVLGDTYLVVEASQFVDTGSSFNIYMNLTNVSDSTYIDTVVSVRTGKIDTPSMFSQFPDFNFLNFGETLTYYPFLYIDDYQILNVTVVNEFSGEIDNLYISQGEFYVSSVTDNIQGGSVSLYYSELGNLLKQIRFVRDKPLSIDNNYLVTIQAINIHTGTSVIADTFNVLFKADFQQTDIPTQIQSLSFDEMIGNTSKSYFANSYFNDYQTFMIDYYDDTETQRVSLFADKNGVESSFTGDFITRLKPSVDDVELEFISINKDITKNVNITVFNSFGSYTTYSVLVTSNDSVILTQEEIKGDSLVGLFVNIFDGLFPDSDTLNAKQRFSYVLVTVFFITILIIGVGVRSSITGKTLFTLALVIDVLLVVYFIFIGYIEIGTLVLLVLVLLALTYFKFGGG